MQRPSTLFVFLLVSLTSVVPAQQASRAATEQSGGHEHIGFDRNFYPGEAALPALRKYFSFTGYWLTNPPGERENTWVGKREALLREGFGFLVLANGRLDTEILRAQKSGTTADALGQRDAAVAVAAAKREHFPAQTIIFLDQEEGGRLLPEQSTYLLAWTETVARSGYLPGLYASGQPVKEGSGIITTIQDIRAQIDKRHLHQVAMWVYQDTCPPSSGCTLQPPPPASSGTPNITAWQYAQSPRRKDNTLSCAKTYAPDGNCYAPGLPKLYLDLNISPSADPSHGRGSD